MSSPRPTSPPRSRRRLLIVAETLRGGLGGVVREQVDWFADRGWSVSVVSPLDDEGVPPPRAQHYPVSIPVSARDVPAMARAISKTHRIVRLASPTVIHCHGLRSFSIAKLASSTRPYVTLHGTGTISDDPWGYGVVRALALRMAPLFAVEAFNAGPEQRAGWIFMPHASPRLATLSKRPLPEPGNEPVFLWLGRLSEPKLPSLFVESISAAAKVTPLRGLLAGDGPLSGEIARRIAELGAPVDVLGRTDDVEPLLAKSWGLVLFSRFEALAFSAQEAMWVGRAVVSSPLPGVRWLLGDAGIVASDLAGATDAILRLTDHATAKRLGDRAALRVRELVGPGAPWASIEAAYLRHLDDSD